MGIIYESSIIENDKTIRDKYISIVIEYLINISYKNMSPFIINRGLDTITHVFILLLYYTQHLETVYTYSQKSLYLYIEFIEQIAFDKNSFLQLSSKDAVIYVYKKTLYEIKHSCCKKNENIDRHKKNYLCIEYYKSILHFIIQQDTFRGKHIDLQKVKDYLLSLSPLLFSSALSPQCQPFMLELLELFKCDPT
jgi:hypothetical protein